MTEKKHKWVSLLYFIHDFLIVAVKARLADENETGLGISELGECHWFWKVYVLGLGKLWRRLNLGENYKLWIRILASYADTCKAINATDFDDHRSHDTLLFNSKGSQYGLLLTCKHFVTVNNSSLQIAIGQWSVDSVLYAGVYTPFTVSGDAWRRRHAARQRVGE